MNPMATSCMATVVIILVSLGGCEKPQAQNAQRPKKQARSPSGEVVIPVQPAKSRIADWLQWTPTDFFDSPNEPRLCEAISSGDMKNLKSLLSADTDLNSQGRFGMSLLYWAFIEENMAAFQLLLEHGADPDLVLTEDIGAHQRYNVFLRGDTVLFTSLRCWKPTYCTTALKHTRNPHQRDRFGYNLLQVFLQPGSGGEEHLQALIDARIDLNVRGPDGSTPCHQALLFTNPKYCLQLLKAGADPSIRDNEADDLADTLEFMLWREEPGEHDKRLDPLIAWLNENYREIRRSRP